MNYPKPKDQVICKECETKIDVYRVHFIDIEETFSGQDMLTFICPDCETEQQSYIITRK